MAGFSLGRRLRRPFRRAKSSSGSAAAADDASALLPTKEARVPKSMQGRPPSPPSATPGAPSGTDTVALTAATVSTKSTAATNESVRSASPALFANDGLVGTCRRYKDRRSPPNTGRSHRPPTPTSPARPTSPVSHVNGVRVATHSPRRPPSPAARDPPPTAAPAPPSRAAKKKAVVASGRASLEAHMPKALAQLAKEEGREATTPAAIPPRARAPSPRDGPTPAARAPSPGVNPTPMARPPSPKPNGAPSPRANHSPIARAPSPRADPTPMARAPSPKTGPSLTASERSASRRASSSDGSAAAPPTPTAKPPSPAASTINMPPPRVARAPSPAALSTAPTARTPSPNFGARSLVSLARTRTPVYNDKYDPGRDRYDGPLQRTVTPEKPPPVRDGPVQRTIAPEKQQPKTSRRELRSHGPSPTGVVELADSHDKDKYSLIENEAMERPERAVGGLGQQPPAMPLPPSTKVKPAKEKSGSMFKAPEASAEGDVPSPPQVTRFDPSKDFGDAKAEIGVGSKKDGTTEAGPGWGPSSYTSLEEAVASHAAMLTSLASPKRDEGNAEEGPAKNGGTAVAGAVAREAPGCSIETESASRCSIETEPVSKGPSPEFLARKKNAEKGEFKKAESSAKHGLQEAIEVQPASPRGLAQTGTGCAGDEYVRRDSTDPPGVDRTDACAGSLERESPDRFGEEGASEPVELPEKRMPLVDTPRNRPTSPTKTVAAVPPPALANDGAASDDSAPSSFPFEEGNFDVDVQYSVSDDGSYTSYYSDMDLSYGSYYRSDDDLARLMELREQYEKDARANVRHPSRIQRSILAAGSAFRTDGAHGGSTVAPSKKAKAPRRKLTWYDDEENWSKPFLLRTDESWENTTLTSESFGRPRAATALGEFFKGIVRAAACGGEEAVAGFDAAGEQEI